MLRSFNSCWIFQKYPYYTVLLVIWKLVKNCSPSQKNKQPWTLHLNHQYRFTFMAGAFLVILYRSQRYINLALIFKNTTVSVMLTIKKRCWEYSVEYWKCPYSQDIFILVHLDEPIKIKWILSRKTELAKIETSGN